MKVLKCSTCSKTYHEWCLDPPRRASLVRKSLKPTEPQRTWQCAECRSCQVCLSTSNKERLLVCEMCDYSVHTHCLKPSLSKLPPSGWYCQDCIYCLSCQTKLPPISDYSRGFWAARQWGPKESPVASCRLCEDCNALYAEGNFCPLCNKTYDNNGSENFVCCDNCENWIHAYCDGITDDDFSKIENEKYICPICRKK